MENSQKTLLGLVLVFIIYIGVSILPMIDYYKPKSYIEINGKKFTLSDLEKEKPNIVYKTKKDYLENLRRGLEQFAYDKIIELEAKEKKVNPDDLLKSATENYNPSPTEIQAVYEQYKEQIGKATLEESRDRIVGYLKGLQEQKFTEELMAKYKTEFFMEELKTVRQKVEDKGNPSIGPKDAKVTIIEFSDFQCPWCQRSQSTTRQLREQYKDKIRWVFRDYFIVHPQAKFIHVAANCAIKQNKYWEYFNYIFDNAQGLDEPGLMVLAEKAKLDKTALKECMANPKEIEKEIAVDMADGKSLGINGTPAFFINGILVEGAAPIANFQKIIDEELNK